MRLSIDHRTQYRFSEPQARLVQMLRMTPTDTEDQTIVSWRIDVDCDARLREGRDGFGNRITMLYAEGPIAEIEIAVTGEVLTADTIGVLNGAYEPLPPTLFARSTPTTAADGAISAFAAAVAAETDDRLDQLHRLNAAVRRRFTLDLGRRRPVDAATAFGRKAATPRDLAQVLIAASRSIGAPARFVSGHCVTPFGRESRPTAHSWVEAYVDKLGWVGFDPSFGLSSDDTYVRVAIGLDPMQAAPVAGRRMGGGDEELDVDVHVDVVNEDAAGDA